MGRHHVPVRTLRLSATRHKRSSSLVPRLPCMSTSDLSPLQPCNATSWLPAAGSPACHRPCSRRFAAMPESSHFGPASCCFSEATTTMACMPCSMAPFDSEQSTCQERKQWSAWPSDRSGLAKWLCWMEASAPTMPGPIPMPRWPMCRCRRSPAGSGSTLHWQYIGQLEVYKLRVVFATLEDVSLHLPRERLIRCLVSLARGYGQRDAFPPQTLHVSQERLGSMLSLSRQTVNALLQGLEREKLVICVRGGVRILDFGRLQRLEASIQ